MKTESDDSKDRRPSPPWLYRKLMLIEAPLTGLVGMTCRDFARLSVTRLDRSLSSSESVRLRMHGLMCRVCRGFSGQFDQINTLICEAAEETTEYITASEADQDAAARIEQQVRSRI